MCYTRFLKLALSPLDKRSVFQRELLGVLISKTDFVTLHEKEMLCQHDIYKVCVYVYVLKALAPCMHLVGPFSLREVL